MLTLEPAEKVWLEEYRTAIRTRHPDVVARLLIYGSKARGDAHADSDIDVLLVVNDFTERDRRGTSMSCEEIRQARDEGRA